MTLIKHCTGFFCLLAALTAMPVAGAEEAELLIRGARVIDPETGLDAVRDVALADGRIARVGPAGSLAGAEILDAAGLVLAPGFIDLHAHGASARARDYQVRDGVTTALELEWGYPVIDTYLASRQGKSRVNFGASASHGMLRSLAMVPDSERDALRAELAEAVTAEEPLHALQAFASEGFQKGTSEQQRQRVAGELRRALGEGAIGIGMAHAYYPGADREEILALFHTAETLDTMIFTHARGRGLEAIQEVVANAAATGAALHIVHVNSTSLGEIEAALQLIDGARGRGVDVSTEAYPYTAGSTSIQSALFDGDWQAAYGISHDDLQWQATGERLSPETFEKYRAQGGVIIIHMMREAWIDEAIGRDWVIVASDGMPYAPGAHPRTAGTFARVLGHYSRERGLVDLPTALAKMTLLPAQRLEKIAPGMKTKGRVQTGMDADLVLFDPQRVIDTATFETGPSYSEGIEHVFVAGVAVVKNGEVVPGAYPGRAIRGAGARN